MSFHKTKTHGCMNAVLFPGKAAGSCSAPLPVWGYWQLAALSLGCLTTGDGIAGEHRVVTHWCHCEAWDAQLSLHLQLSDNTRRARN